MHVRNSRDMYGAQPPVSTEPVDFQIVCVPVVSTTHLTKVVHGVLLLRLSVPAIDHSHLSLSDVEDQTLQQLADSLAQSVNLIGCREVFDKQQGSVHSLLESLEGLNRKTWYQSVFGTLRSEGAECCEVQISTKL